MTEITVLGFDWCQFPLESEAAVFDRFFDLLEIVGLGGKGNLLRLALRKDLGRIFNFWAGFLRVRGHFAGSLEVAGDFGLILSELGFFGKVFWAARGSWAALVRLASVTEVTVHGFGLCQFPLENAAAFRALDF